MQTLLIDRIEWNNLMWLLQHRKKAFLFWLFLVKFRRNQWYVLKYFLKYLKGIRLQLNINLFLLKFNQLYSVPRNCYNCKKIKWFFSQSFFFQSLTFLKKQKTATIYIYFQSLKLDICSLIFVVTKLWKWHDNSVLLKECTFYIQCQSRNKK